MFYYKIKYDSLNKKIPEYLVCQHGFYNLEMPVLFLWYVIQLNKDAR